MEYRDCAGKKGVDHPETGRPPEFSPILPRAALPQPV
jgi:hypothetical protein